MKLISCLSAFLLAGALGGVLPAAGEKPSDGNRSFSYLDDHDGRVLADVRLALVRRDGRPALRMTISTVGPLVEPIPGFQGVRGANHFTAEQLEMILAGRFPAAVRTRKADGNAPRTGTLTAGRRGRIPERRLLHDGRLDFLALSEREYPLEMIADTGPLGPGLYYTEMLLAGVPRLRVTYRISDAGLQVLQFVSLGDVGVAPAVAAQPRQGEGEKEKPLPAPVRDADWDARDPEGKWVLYQKSVTTDGIEPKAWRQYLMKRADFAFLEWVAVYGPDDPEEKFAPARLLAKANAPQWLRVAAWLRQSSLVYGHNEAEARVLLVKHAPALAFAWLAKYQNVLFRKGGPVESDYRDLKKMRLPRADVSKALPPLLPAEVFAYLEAPPELAEFGDRTRVEPGKVYLHQVRRAIQAVVRSGLYEEPWLGKVLKLTRHRRPEVRREAYLAFTHFARQADPKAGTIDEFVAVLDDARKPAADREGALLAFSYYRHPKVFVKLHAMALDPKHPAWSAAVSRLNEVGNEFTVRHLARLAKVKLAAADERLVRTTRENIEKWVEESGDNVLAPSAADWLEQAAWAEHVNDPLKTTLTPWVRELFTKRGGPRLEAALRKIEASYSPSFPVPGGEDSFRQRVRELARAILAAR